MILGVNRTTIQRNVLTQLYNFLGGPPPSSKSTEARIYGRNVYFVGVNDEGAVRNILGATLALAYGDEVATWPQSCFRMLESRLSVPGAMAIFTCNPEGPAHWFKKEIIDSDDSNIIHWSFLLDDNPSLDESFKEAIKRRYTGMWYKRYILGEWAVAHGLIYDSFDQENIYDRARNNPTHYVVGIDYGTSNATAAVLLAINPSLLPQISVEDEYYYDSAQKGRQKTDDELATDIKRWIQYKSIQAIYVDPSAASFKLELRNRDLPVIDANNDVLEGIKVTSKFIANKNLVINRSCKTLLDAIQSYSWCPKAADRGEDKPLKVKDHVMDALRYACFTHFPNGNFSQMDRSTYDDHRKQFYGDNLQNPLWPQGGGGYY
jgi:PBSX family phage terminase large subunit